jgi:hypothetical protein
MRVAQAGKENAEAELGLRPALPRGSGKISSAPVCDWSFLFSALVLRHGGSASAFGTENATGATR